MGTEQDLRRIAELASEAADRVAKKDDPALGALLSEMQALEDVLPGLGSARSVDRPPVVNTAIDAEIEASFDNMPV